MFHCDNDHCRLKGDILGSRYPFQSKIHFGKVKRWRVSISLVSKGKALVSNKVDPFRRGLGLCFPFSPLPLLSLSRLRLSSRVPDM